MKNASWLWNSVIYHILIDRFFDGRPVGHSPAVNREQKPAFCGGNLQGVAAKLDYLLDLGVNTLWLSPFTRTAAYHGYHVTDFLRVEPRFGGEKGFKTLVTIARKQGIRLIMDFVPNHVHESHPWFQDARTSQRSRYRNWFCWKRNGDYLKFLDFGELPKLNLDHPAARAEIIRAAKYWMDQGIDGFRLDHALGPSMDFWREFRLQLKQHNEDVALIGEVCFAGISRKDMNTLGMPDKRSYFLAQELGFDVLSSTMREYAGVFDGLLDFHFQRLLQICVAQSKQRMSTRRIQSMLDQHYASFPKDCALLSFLDNHDMNRFLFDAGGDKTRLKRAIEIQLTQRHPPVIYYGTEIGMSQSASIHGQDYGDLRVRGMMRWQDPDDDIAKCYQGGIRKWKSLHKNP